jgi:hypothetical protein
MIEVQIHAVDPARGAHLEGEVVDEPSRRRG